MVTAGKPSNKAATERCFYCCSLHLPLYQDCAQKRSDGSSSYTTTLLETEKTRANDEGHKRLHQSSRLTSFHTFSRARTTYRSTPNLRFRTTQTTTSTLGLTPKIEPRTLDNSTSTDCSCTMGLYADLATKNASVDVSGQRALVSGGTQVLERVSHFVLPLVEHPFGLLDETKPRPMKFWSSFGRLLLKRNVALLPPPRRRSSVLLSRPILYIRCQESCSRNLRQSRQRRH